MRGADLVLGTVELLRRYPVKSMRGETVAASVVGERGLAGDRAYALLDQTDGKVVSAKYPRRWGHLLACRATLTAEPQPGAPPPIAIEFPDGAILRGNAPDIDDRLSAALGRAVHLTNVAPPRPTLARLWLAVEGLAPADTRPAMPAGAEDAVAEVQIGGGAPAGTFFDAAPIHLVTTATLDYLGRCYPEGRFDPRRFRPNLVVETAPDAAGGPEQGWIGRTLRVGPEVVLRVLTPTARCAIPTLAQDELPADVGIARAIAQHSRVDVLGKGRYGCVGVYAAVVRSGVVRRGDAIALD